MSLSRRTSSVPSRGGAEKTVFTLSNGQVWRQRTGSNYRHTADGQTVAVKKNFMGLWTLTGTLFGPHGGGLPDRLRGDPRPAAGMSWLTLFL